MCDIMKLLEAVAVRLQAKTTQEAFMSVIKIKEIAEQQLQQAHHAGWEQAKREAVKAAKHSHHPEGCFCDWCRIAHNASAAVAAMEYKEPTNDRQRKAGKVAGVGECSPNSSVKRNHCDYL